ncbi:DUF2934 domain-containing protein [uncultured Lamprocystis sp.]|jgi:hypothetical protein|nr:DUF2934 domain-containing protein [uncultured Lamprocystis sp.]
MASLQKIDRAADRSHNRHEGSGNEQVPQVIADPTSDDALSQAISEAAYYRAEARGFESGHELEDWIAAEGQVVRANNPAAEAARS